MAQRVRKHDIGLKSEMLSFGDLLGGDHSFAVPYLQRPFEWGEAEVADMASDLVGACEGGYLSYFLGHIVGVRTADKRIEVVDGQQRFITTTIMLAYFRDRLPARKSELWEALQACIMGDGQPRLTPRPSDAAFLLEWVQTPGRMDALAKDWGKDETPPYQAVTDAQVLMAQAARTIRGKLDRLGHEAIEKLAWFVLDRAVIDFIIADNRSMAAILYRGMNMRGKKLSPADLVKLEAIEGAGLPEDVRETAARTWERIEEKLRGEFDFLLEIVPLLVSRETTVRPGDLAEWRKQAFRNADAETLLLQLLPVYADVFEEVMSGEIAMTVRDRGEQQAAATVNRLLKGLLFLTPHERRWIAPAIGAVHANRERPHFLATFFRGLDRFTFASFLDALSDRDRRDRFAGIVRAGADPGQLEHAFELRPGEATAMLRRLGEPFSRHTTRRRAMAARVNAAFPGGYSFGQTEDVTLEHVCPTSFSPVWAARGWTSAATRACSDLIGNFVLVTQAQNNKAGQKPIEEKFDIYFNWPGAPVHPITEDVRRYTEWTERHVRARTDRFIAMLAADWDLA